MGDNIAFVGMILLVLFAYYMVLSEEPQSAENTTVIESSE